MRGRKGFSFVEVVVAIGLVGTVLTVAGYVINQTKTVEMRTGAQADLDRMHLIKLQQLRSSSYLRSVLPLTTALKKCLAGKGSGCDRVVEERPKYPKAGPTTTTHPGPVIDWQTVEAASEKISCAGKGCTLSSDVSFRPICSSSGKCERIEIRVASNLSGQDLRERSVILRIPASLLIDHSDIAFECTDEGNAKGIDLAKSEVDCFSSQLTNCGSAKRPVQGISADAQERCPPPVRVSCGTNEGVRLAGAYQAVCDQ